MPKQLRSIRIKQGVVRLWNMIEIFLYFMWVEGWVDISSTKQPNDWMWFNLVVSTNTYNYFIRRPVRLPKALNVVHFHCDSFYTTLSKSCCQYCFFCHKWDALMHWLYCVALLRITGAVLESLSGNTCARQEWPLLLWYPSSGRKRELILADGWCEVRV